MAKRRIKLAVYVNLEDVPGQLYSPESARVHVRDILTRELPNNDVQVLDEHDPTDLRNWEY